MDQVQVGGQSPLDVLREVRGEEALHDLGIIRALEGKAAQTVIMEEAIEDLSGKHHRGRHRDQHARELLDHAEVSEEMPNEGKGAGLAAHAWASTRA